MLNKVDRKIYAFWTGENPMSEQRYYCLATKRKNWEVPVELITCRDIPNYLINGEPLHPAFKYLSCNHKSDYLRCYWMHFYGGGYADIKQAVKIQNWSLCFSIINAHPEIEIVGMPEVKGGAARKAWDTWETSYKLLANGWFICRPQTEFTRIWYARLLSRMDNYAEALRQNPATNPFGGSGYPVPWYGLMGDLFHELIVDCREQRPNAICSGLMPGVKLRAPYR